MEPDENPEPKPEHNVDIAAIKNLTCAVFAGAANKKMKQMIKNKCIVNAFSKAVALVNKDVFKDKMKDKVEEKYRNQINEIPSYKEPMIDDFGRVTYFYLILGGVPIPLYQPGTVMFESAVSGDSDLSVVAHGSQ
jgi:hypothetical protein